MESLIRKSIESLKSKEKEDKAASNSGVDESTDLKLIINNKNYTSIPLSESNLYSIERKSSQKRFAFVDGGNQNIFSNENMSIDAIRVYYAIWKEEKKVESKRYDFVCITTVRIDESKKMSYRSELITDCDVLLPPEILTFDPKDETLRTGVFDCKVSDIAGKIRRFLELSVARKVAQERLELYETIVLDGILQETIVHEHEFMFKLREVANKKGVLVCAVSKSTTVYTNSEHTSDELLISLSNKIGFKRFVYTSVFSIDSDTHFAEIYFAKFHERSLIVLRVELFKDAASCVDVTKLFSQIAFFCKDPILLGYPYGLIDADKFARIGNDEASYLRTIFLVKSSKGNIDNSSDLHSILDNISY
jgi:hypothetical protein